MVCSFHFDDICIKKELASGCYTGKISGIHVLHILIEKCFSTVLMKGGISGYKKIPSFSG